MLTTKMSNKINASTLSKMGSQVTFSFGVGDDNSQYISPDRITTRKSTYVDQKKNKNESFLEKHESSGKKMSGVMKAFRQK